MSTSTNTTTTSATGCSTPILIPLVFPVKCDEHKATHWETDQTNDSICFAVSLSSSVSEGELGIHRWAMIEINGELITPQNMLRNGCDKNEITCNSTRVSCYELGSVHFLSENEPVMVIESHELKGSIQELKQPFCVLQKRQQKTVIRHPNGLNPDNETSSLTKSIDTTTYYNVIGIVSAKLLFDRYPKAIVRQSL